MSIPRKRRSEIIDMAKAWAGRILETALDCADLDLDYDLTEEEGRLFAATVMTISKRL